MLSANGKIDLIMYANAKRQNTTVPKGQTIITNDTFFWNTLDNEYDSDNGERPSFVIRSGETRKIDLYFGKYISVISAKFDTPDTPAAFIVDGELIALRCYNTETGVVNRVDKRFYATRNKTVTVEAVFGSFNFIIGTKFRDYSDSESDSDSDAEYVYQILPNNESDTDSDISDDYDWTYESKHSDRELERLVHRDNLVEQIDDFGPDLKPKKKSPLSTESSHKSIAVQDILKVQDVHMSIQALEAVDTTTGNERMISRQTTPDGPKDVIHLANADVSVNKRLDYMMSTFLPTSGFVWNKVDTDYSNFNSRTVHYMVPYERYHCQYLYRLLAKPSLFASARYWVSLHDTTSVGFEWNPAEENDIYVLVPWQEAELTLPTTTYSCPPLHITDLSSMIYADGVATTIDISVFVAPFNMFLYNPIPVEHVIPQASNIDVKYFPLIDLEFVNEQSNRRTNLVVVSGSAYSCFSARIFGENRYIIGTTDVCYTTPTLTQNYNPLLTKGTHKISWQPTTTDTLVLACSDDFRYYFDKDAHLGEEPARSPRFSNMKRVQVGLPANSTQTVNLPTASLVLCTETGNPGTTSNVVTILDNNTILFDYSIRRLISSPTFLPAGTYHIRFDTTKTGESTSMQIISGSATGPLLQEQILELSYNNNFKDNHSIVGKPAAHTKHVDTHWDFVRKVDFNTESDFFNVTIPINEQTRGRRDIRRHIMFSKHPVVQLSAASIPSSNILLRVTPYHGFGGDISRGFDRILQVPGMEWDPKTGPLFFRPQWTHQYPMASVNESEGEASPNFSLNVLAGTIVEPVSVVVKVNYAAVDYHGLFIDHLEYTTPNRLVEQIEEEIPSATPATDVVVSSETAINTADGVLTEVATSTVAMPDNQPSDRVTGVAGRFEFVHSDSIGPDVAVYYYALNYQMFGREALEEYRGYKFWTGKPKFKIALTSSSTTAADAHIFQLPPNINVTELTYPGWVNLTKSRPAGAISIRDGCYETEMEWMAPIVRLGRDDFMGYLAIVMPFSNQDSGTQYQPTDIIISLFTDSANVKFSTDREYVPLFNEQPAPPLTETVLRPAAMMSKQVVERPNQEIEALTANVNALMQMMSQILGSGTSFVQRGATNI